ECLIELFGEPATVTSKDAPKERPLSGYDQASFLETLVYDRSDALDRAVHAMFVKATDDKVQQACLLRLAGRGYDADIETYLKRRLPAAEKHEREMLQESGAK